MNASKKLSANLWTAVVALACLALMPSAALGFATFSALPATDFSDLATNPNDYYSWDLTNLTYSFDASFDAAWPNPLVKDQIRLAFSQWDTADAMANGAVYSYGRAAGWQPFGDIRSIVTHELGHVLGLHHPDQADDVNRNWRWNGGPITSVHDQYNEVMRSWINPGDYNHVLSHDELDAFRYMYNHDLTFTETTGTGNIVISAYNPGNPNNWAEGGGSGVWRSTDHTQGVRMTSGFVHLNTASGQPLGLRTLGINWDYQNVGGQPTRNFIVRTTGTNNPDPLFHYDNNGPHPFTDFATMPAGVDSKDDLSHIWLTPAAYDIPAGEILHVGLEQDVWDWSVVSATVVHPGGATTAAPLLGMHDWSHTIVTGTPAAAGPDGTCFVGPKTTVLARGLRIAASDVATLVSGLALACVDDMGLGLDDLNREMLLQLRRNDMVEDIEEFGQQTLAPGRDFIIVFEGTEDDLPPDVQKNGNFMILNRPEYLDQELFVFAQSTTLEGEGVVGTYGLLGTGIIVPEPATLALLGAGLAGLIVRRRRRK